MSWRLRITNLILRLVEKPYLARETDYLSARMAMDIKLQRLFALPAATHQQPDRLSHDGRHVPVLWVSVGRARRRAILLYFHGGAYVLGSPRSHRHVAAQVSALTGMRAVVPDYLLAPENPFPAAVEDAVICYRALLDAGYDPASIALCGDSAGGGLALALLHEIGVHGLAPPSCLVAFSPWTDLTLAGASMRENVASDVLLPVERVTEIRDTYLAGADPHDPRASPLFGRFGHAGPVLIQASRTELLRDDARRMKHRLEAQGCAATLDLWSDVPHAFQVFLGHIPEADEAIARAAQFLRAHVAGLQDTGASRSVLVPLLEKGCAIRKSAAVQRSE